jgi:hypothetical protein
MWDPGAPEQFVLWVPVRIRFYFLFHRFFLLLATFRKVSSTPVTICCGV